MTNLAFTALIKSKGYNKKRLSEECHIPAAVISQRINGRSPWEWREVGRVCQALDITYDDFARYFPSGIVRPTTKETTREERVDNLLAQLREVLIERV